MPVTITSQDTPNPNARRFLLDKPVQEEARGRVHAHPSASDDPLVAQVLNVPGVTSVLTLPTSLTVNKSEDASWDDVSAAVQEALERYFA